MTKFCPACGEKLVDNANFCRSCGANLNSDAPRARAPERPASEKSYSIHIIVGYVLALLVPLLGVVIGFYLMTRKDSDDAKRHGKYVLIAAVVIMALSSLSFFR